MEECPICSVNSVIEEEENGRKIRVCTECGAMDDDMQEYASQQEGTTLTDGQGRAPSAARPSVKNSSAVSISKGITFGTNAIKSFGKIMHFDESMMGEACSLYERVYPEELKNATFDTRLAMSVACLYAIGRKHETGIAVRDMAQFLQGRNTHVRFGESLKNLKIRYNVQLPPVSFISEAHFMLSQVHMPKEVIELTKKMLVLMEHLFLTQARATCISIIAASYYAWKAHDYIKNRKLSFKNYCEQFKFSNTTQARERKVEIECALRALVIQLPWMQLCDKKNVDITPHIQDVLKYQSSLRQGAILSAITEIQQIMKKNDYIADDTEEQLEAYIEHGHVFRRNRKRPYQIYLKDMSKGESESEMITVKKSKTYGLSVGSSDTMAESKSQYGASDNGDAKENFEDDSDISCYIKTEKEVQDFKLLLSKFEDDSVK